MKFLSRLSADHVNKLNIVLMVVAAWVAYANGDASVYGTPEDIVIGVDDEGND